MWTYGPWGWFSFMWVFPILCIVFMLFFFTRRWPRWGDLDGRHRESSAREILDRRYASGELTKDEYRRMRSDIE